MHSPWGLNWFLMKETGQSLHYLMWKVSWINILMMMADAPGHEWIDEEEQATELKNEEDFKRLLD